MASPSQRRKARDRALGIVLVALAAVFAIGVVLFRFYLEQGSVQLDPQTLCPLHGGPQGYVAVLLDFSDPPNDVQRASLRRALEENETEIPAHHRVQVIPIRPNDAPGLPEPSFSRCKPPWEENASGLTQNPDLLKKQWLEGYLRPLNEALEAAPSTPDSPLMKLIQSAAVTAFPAASSDLPKRLIIVSDFLEHTPDYSHYGTSPPRFQDFLESKRSVARRVRVDLSGFEIRMLYLRRDRQDAVQAPAHKIFWSDYLVWCGIGAGDLEIIDIAG